MIYATVQLRDCGAKGTKRYGTEEERKGAGKKEIHREWNSEIKKNGWKMRRLSVGFIKLCLARLQIRNPNSIEPKLMNDCHIEL